MLCLVCLVLDGLNSDISFVMMECLICFGRSYVYVLYYVSYWSVGCVFGCIFGFGFGCVDGFVGLAGGVGLVLVGV